MPEMLDRFVQHSPNARSGFKLYFSAEPFPGYSAKLVLIRREYGGNWYGWPETRMQGWLCPAMFKYFEKTPLEIYCKAEANTTSLAVSTVICLAAVLHIAADHRQ
jgi:hypothetical protein